jgi:hypothetical protein
VWLSIGAGLATSFCALSSGRRLPFATFSGVVLIVLWAAFIMGAGAYYQYYGRLLTKISGIRIPVISGVRETSGGSVGFEDPDPMALAYSLASIRDGFVASGGSTNLVRERRGTAAVGPKEVLVDVGVGLAAVYVPISILRATRLVTFDGGRGFLTLTDCDTLFLDFTMVAVLAVLWRWRVAMKENLPAVVCFAALTLISAVVIAYAVTNFGTLFRLRLMIATPGWMLLLTIAGDRLAPTASERVVGART